MTHIICVYNVTIIGSDNGLTHGRRQAIIWTNVGILLIEPLGTNFSEIVIEIITFSVGFNELRSMVAEALMCGQHFADDISTCIYTIENLYIFIQSSLKIAPKDCCVLRAVDTKDFHCWQVSIGSGNGLAPDRLQAIIWWPSPPMSPGLVKFIKFVETPVKLQWKFKQFSVEKIHLEMPSVMLSHV